MSISSTGGASVTLAVSGVGASTSSVVAPTTTQVEQSVAPATKQVKVCVVEPCHHPCLLNSFGSTATQAELDELRHCFSIPRSIFTRVPKLGELP